MKSWNHTNWEDIFYEKLVLCFLSPVFYVCTSIKKARVFSAEESWVFETQFSQTRKLGFSQILCFWENPVFPKQLNFLFFWNYCENPIVKGDGLQNLHPVSFSRIVIHEMKACQFAYFESHLKQDHIPHAKWRHIRQSWKISMFFLINPIWKIAYKCRGNSLDILSWTYPDAKMTAELK